MAAITASAAEVIAQLEKSHGNISHAARKLGTSRQTLHKFINERPTVAAALEDMRESEIDDAELMLYDRMRQSDTLLIFFLKTRGNKRGYSERSQVEVTGPDGGAIRSDTTVTHTFDTDKAKEVLDILTLAGAFDVATEADSKSLDGAQSDA